MEFLTSYSWYSKWIIIYRFSKGIYVILIIHRGVCVIPFLSCIDMLGREQFLAFYISGGKIHINVIQFMEQRLTAVALY